MKMKLWLSGLALTAVAAGCRMFGGGDAPVATAVSPDGRNEIRLWRAPLSYEVRRDGRVVAARTRISMKIDGHCLLQAAAEAEPKTTNWDTHGVEAAPVYKKGSIDLASRRACADFGLWGVELAARDDGVAYRFETRFDGRVTVNRERADVRVPCSEMTCWVNETGRAGCEETVNATVRARDIVAGAANGKSVYLPFLYRAGETTVAVTESDVCDYPIWNLVRARADEGVALEGVFSKWPTAMRSNSGKDRASGAKRERNWHVTATAENLVETDGKRTFPWRAFILADCPARLAESDLVRALARPAAAGDDFAWVKPGKVAWDWWNAFDNKGDPDGCTTETYLRFIDFAAKQGVEYVIMDEGWSEKLNIWKFSARVDVPKIIAHANAKGVGIILWMAWAQIDGEEERVAAHFAKLGAKGFKVDFMDRGDAACERFLWTFAEACRKHRMLVDYHGAHRPTGMSRAYPNVLNYEGVHGLECMKFYRGEDILANDVKVCFGRMTAGPLDYTPGAMDNYPVGRYPTTSAGFQPRSEMCRNPGSLGTRARQMAMMTVFEAPLQMLCDSPTKYEKNAESFAFMAATPVVWDRTVGLGGCPDSYFALARQAKDGAWYAAGIADSKARTCTFRADFLGEGVWNVEIFRDAPTSDAQPRLYLHERRAQVRAGDQMTFDMAPGGGFVARFTK